jgi:hypothetical protein
MSRCPSGKRGYGDYASAVRGLDAVLTSTTRAGTADEIRIYECRMCGEYHLSKVITLRPRGKGRGKAGRPRKGVA